MDLDNSFRRKFLGWVGECRPGQGIWSRSERSGEAGQGGGSLISTFVFFLAAVAGV